MTASATAVPVKDEALIAAWRRFTIARATLSVLPDEPCEPGQTDSPAALAQYAIMDPAEDFIVKAQAESIRGVEIKLWLSIARNINRNEVDTLCALREDERHFREGDHELDWIEKIIFSAIQGLRELQEADRRAEA